MTSPEAGLSPMYVWVRRQLWPEATRIGGNGIARRRIWEHRRDIIGVNGDGPEDKDEGEGEGVDSGEGGAVMSISTAVYPFSANMLDHSVHASSSLSEERVRPRARMKISGMGHSRMAAGLGWRMRYRVQDAEEQGIEVDSEREGLKDEKPRMERVVGWRR